MRDVSSLLVGAAAFKGHVLYVVVSGLCFQLIFLNYCFFKLSSQANISDGYTPPHAH
jgi:hypothetical protein